VIEYNKFIHYFNNHPETFNPSVGWGIDKMLRKFMFELNLFAVRDRSHTLMHPSSTSYNTSLASEESKRIMKIADEFFNENELESISTINEKIMSSADKEDYKMLVNQLNKLE